MLSFLFYLYLSTQVMLHYPQGDLVCNHWQQRCWCQTDINEHSAFSYAVLLTNSSELICYYENNQSRKISLPNMQLSPYYQGRWKRIEQSEWICHIDDVQWCSILRKKKPSSSKATGFFRN
jgi:hypothetical protein